MTCTIKDFFSLGQTFHFLSHTGCNFLALTLTKWISLCWHKQPQLYQPAVGKLRKKYWAFKLRPPACSSHKPFVETGQGSKLYLGRSQEKRGDGIVYTCCTVQSNKWSMSPLTGVLHLCMCLEISSHASTLAHMDTVNFEEKTLKAWFMHLHRPCAGATPWAMQSARDIINICVHAPLWLWCRRINLRCR